MVYFRLWWMWMRITVTKLYIERRVRKGYEKKSAFHPSCPDPQAFINHCICDFSFTPPIRVLPTKEWEILEQQMREGKISPKKKEEFFSYQESMYTLNSIGMVLGGLGLLAESFLKPPLSSAYMTRIEDLAKTRSRMALHSVRTTHAYMIDVMHLLLDAKKDFSRH